MKFTKTGGKGKKFLTICAEAFGLKLTYMRFYGHPEMFYLELEAGSKSASINIECNDKVTVRIGKRRRTRSISNMIHNVNEWFRVRLIDIITNRKIFLIHDGYDCDWTYSRAVVCCKNWRDYDRYVENAYDNAEGPENFQRISKQEYLEEKELPPVHRNLVEEAFEDGHSHSVTMRWGR